MNATVAKVPVLDDGEYNGDNIGKEQRDDRWGERVLTGKDAG